MPKIITEDGTVLMNGVSQVYRSTEERSLPPSSADPREPDQHEDHHDRDYAVYSELVLRS